MSKQLVKVLPEMLGKQSLGRKHYNHSDKRRERKNKVTGLEVIIDFYGEEIKIRDKQEIVTVKRYKYKGIGFICS